MPAIRTVCVYCGSSSRVASAYREAAADLGRRLAEAGLAVIYGGGRVGLMGIVADAALSAGGAVVGIIPEHIKVREIDHQGLSELIVTASMHERKALMAERSDAFVILPGGLGTLDETFEILTWKMLGLHASPVVIVDTEGYWTPLTGLIDHCVGAGFAPASVKGHYAVVSTPADAVALLAGEPAAPVRVRTDKM